MKLMDDVFHKQAAVLQGTARDLEQAHRLLWRWLRYHKGSKGAKTAEEAQQMCNRRSHLVEATKEVLGYAGVPLVRALEVAALDRTFDREEGGAF